MTDWASLISGYDISGNLIDRLNLMRLIQGAAMQMGCKPSPRACLDFVISRTLMFGKDYERIPHRHFVEGVWTKYGDCVTAPTGLSRTTVIVSLNELEEMGLIEIQNEVAINATRPNRAGVFRVPWQDFIVAPKTLWLQPYDPLYRIRIPGVRNPDTPVRNPDTPYPKSGHIKDTYENNSLKPTPHIGSDPCGPDLPADPDEGSGEREFDQWD